MSTRRGVPDESFQLITRVAVDKAIANQEFSERLYDFDEFGRSIDLSLVHRKSMAEHATYTESDTLG